MLLKTKGLKNTLFIIFLLFSILVAAIIFVLSHQNSTESVGTSQGITAAVIDWVTDLLGSYSKAEKLLLLEKLHSLTRVLGHFLGFATLSFFISGSFAFSGLKKSLKIKYFLGIALSFLYSLSDEIHQYFIPGRAFQLFDIGVDFLGILLGLAAFALLYSIFKKIIKRKNKNK